MEDLIIFQGERARGPKALGGTVTPPTHLVLGPGSSQWHLGLGAGCGSPGRLWGAQLLSEVGALDPAGDPGAELGREEKLSLTPYRCQYGPPVGSLNLQPGRARTTQFCQFLKPSWLRSKTKQPNPSLT